MRLRMVESELRDTQGELTTTRTNEQFYKEQYEQLRALVFNGIDKLFAAVNITANSVRETIEE